jgi:hypothetical protein
MRGQRRADRSPVARARDAHDPGDRPVFELPQSERNRFDRWHPNARGHTCPGEAIERRLRETVLLGKKHEPRDCRSERDRQRGGAEQRVNIVRAAIAALEPTSVERDARK